MEIEIKVEGAVIRGSIERSPIVLTSFPGPGIVLSGFGPAEMVASYRKATALDDRSSPAMDQIEEAKSRLRTDPSWRPQIDRIEKLARGSASVERALLMDLRCIGEPFLVFVEQRELVSGVTEWGLVGAQSETPVGSITSLGVWVPDESMYGEMERLTRIYAGGSLTRSENGRFLACIADGTSQSLACRDEAVAWLDFHVTRPVSDYSPEQQAMAMSRAAWDRAKASMVHVNSVINLETYNVVASLSGINGEMVSERAEGLVGEDSARHALMQLIEQIHPTAFPMPRMH
jgi:hypothetical protein